MAIKQVWIEEGCLICNGCEPACPTVFHVSEDNCFIRAEVRADGLSDTNRTARSALIGNLGTELEAQIIQAAESCPVEVIKFSKA